MRRALLLLLCGCSGCSPDNVVGVDSGPPHDAGRDHSTTLPDSAPDSDLPQEAGATWFPPGDWAQPFLGQGCSARVALQPNQAISAWAYKACIGGSVGCEEATQDWQTGTSAFKPLAIGWYPVRQAFGKPIFVYRRFYPRDLPTNAWAIVDVLQELDGPRLVAVGDTALGNPSPCTAKLVPTSTAIGWWLTAFSTKPTIFLSGSSSWQAPSTASGMRAFGPSDLGGAAASINEWSGAAGSLYLGVLSPVNTIVVDAANQGGVTFPASQTPMEAMLEVPDGVVGIAGGPYGLRHMGATGVTRMIHTSPGDFVANGLGFDQSNSKLVVQEAITGQNGWQDGRLLQAPYVSSTTALAPTLLTKLPSDYDYARGFVVANGFAVLSRGANAARVVRLSDGFGWDITAPPNRLTLGPLWVDQDYVWYLVGEATSKNPLPSRIWRQSRASWGPPTVPPLL